MKILPAHTLRVCTVGTKIHVLNLCFYCVSFKESLLGRIASLVIDLLTLNNLIINNIKADKFFPTAIVLASKIHFTKWELETIKETLNDHVSRSSKLTYKGIGRQGDPRTWRSTPWILSHFN